MNMQITNDYENKQNIQFYQDHKKGQQNLKNLLHKKDSKKKGGKAYELRRPTRFLI